MVGEVQDAQTEELATGCCGVRLNRGGSSLTCARATRLENPKTMAGIWNVICIVSPAVSIRLCAEPWARDASSIHVSRETDSYSLTFEDDDAPTAWRCRDPYELVLS